MSTGSSAPSGCGSLGGAVGSARSPRCAASMPGAGPAVLSRALRIIRDAYGEAGLDGAVIDGIGLLCQRYDGDLGEQRAVERLSTAHGRVSGLLNGAGQLRQSTGSATAQCVAAAAVEIINRGSGGRKLPSWWRNGQ
jgi:hypothetical protein